MERPKREKLAFFLPNTFTALNMGCGFAAIMLSMKGEYYKACMVLMLGAVFDSVDGRVARMTGTQSAFGEQFDSMSDLISFGIAPSLIFYNKFLSHLGRAGMVVAFFFLLCGALRLARFNANIDRVSCDYFQGLPIPGAALAVISYVMLSLTWNHYLSISYLAITYMGFYSVLMISNIPFPSFKNSDWAKKHRKYAFFIILVLLTSVFIYEEIVIPVIITTYVIASLIYALVNRNKFSGIFDWEERASKEPGEAL